MDLKKKPSVSVPEWPVLKTQFASAFGLLQNPSLHPRIADNALRRAHIDRRARRPLWLRDGFAPIEERLHPTVELAWIRSGERLNLFGFNAVCIPATLGFGSTLTRGPP